MSAMRTSGAQDSPERPDTSLRVPVAMPSLLMTAPEDAPSRLVPVQSDTVRRNRWKGALYGLGIGGVGGGVGFAALIIGADGESSGYAPLAFITGAVVGAPVGALIGAVVGVPERREPRSQRRQLLVFPRMSGRGTVGVSLSLLVH